VLASRTALFDYRLEAARDSLSVLSKRADGTLAALHGRLWLLVVEGFMTEDPAVFDAFDAAAEALGDQLDDHDTSAIGVNAARWTRLMAGEMRFLEALVAGRRGSYLSAAWKARSARSRLADLEEDAPEFADPLFALGLIRATVATLPRTQRFVLRVLGFRGDAAEGREQLRRAAEASVTNQYPARAVLAMLDLVVRGDTEAGLRQLRAIYQDTPQSLFSAYLLTFALTENRKISEAEDVLTRAREAETRPGYARLGYLDYFDGYIRFVTADFDAAAEKLLLYTDQHVGDALRAQALLYAGLSTEMSDGWSAAKPIYERVEVFRDFDADRWAARWAEQRQQRPMHTFEKQLLKSRIAFDRGDLATAAELARSVLDLPDSADETSEALSEAKAEAAYRIGRVRHEQEAWDAAVRFYGEAIQREGDDEAKWAPYALYYTGQILRRLGREEDARAMFERAIDWPTPYDYSDGLEQMASSALDA
jgi:tetratricopeptide (TPR) repeat protein